MGAKGQVRSQPDHPAAAAATVEDLLILGERIENAIAVLRAEIKSLYAAKPAANNPRESSRLGVNRDRFNDDPKLITSKFAGTCVVCRTDYDAGDKVWWKPGGKGCWCEDC